MIKYGQYRLRSAMNVLQAEEQLRFATASFLRSKGWQETCETPGCFWLWSIDLKDGRRIMVSRDTAVRMTGAFNFEPSPAQPAKDPK